MPLCSGADVGGAVLGNAIGDNVPHLGIPALQKVLLHAQKRRLRLVFPRGHVAELGEVGLHVLRSMRALEARRPVVFTPALHLEIRLVAVADVGLAQSNQLLGKIVQTLEVVARVGDPRRRES